MPKSPYSRLREACGYTQLAFCERFDVAKMPLVYTEAGVYPEVSQRFVDAILALCVEKGVDHAQILTSEWGTSYLQVAMRKYQQAQREWFRDNGLLEEKPPFDYERHSSPFQYFAVRTAGSLDGFAKRLKVPPTHVSRYASGKTLTMPEHIKDAFESIDYPYLQELQEAQLAYWR